MSEGCPLHSTKGNFELSEKYYCASVGNITTYNGTQPFHKVLKYSIAMHISCLLQSHCTTALLYIVKCYFDRIYISEEGMLVRLSVFLLVDVQSNAWYTVQYVLCGALQLKQSHTDWYYIASTVHTIHTPHAYGHTLQYADLLCNSCTDVLQLL